MTSHSVVFACFPYTLTPARIPTTSSHLHTLTPAHNPPSHHILPSSHPHTCTYTHHTLPFSYRALTPALYTPHPYSHPHIYIYPHTLPSSHPHNCTYTHHTLPPHVHIMHIYPPHPPILTCAPSYLHIYPPHSPILTRAPSYLHIYLPHSPTSHLHTCTRPTTSSHTLTSGYTPTTPFTELGVSDKSLVEVDSDKSDGEETEDVCPICLNELDEGEDLLVCSGCHNHLHQHCMDVCEWHIVSLRYSES